MKSALLALILLLASCSKTPAPLLNPTSPPGEEAKPFLADPPRAALTSIGRDLIYEFEVGGRSGYRPHPESEHDKLSGVTWGIGYDGHQNRPSVIVLDWSSLGSSNARRLAATNPYYGREADAHLHEVRDIIVSWQLASDVFDRIDVAREFARGARWPGFTELRPNAQAALISQSFNRGWETSGPNRTEMAAIKKLVPLKAYEAMAQQMEASSRVWKGTSNYAGLKRRRVAEARLMRTP